MSIALVIGNIIGVGIFLTPASLAPYGLNAVTGWVITVAGCTLLAFSFAVLARSFPQDDGPYGYMHRALGDGAAFMAMWCYWVSTWVTNATIAIGVVGYLTVFIPSIKAYALLPPLVALSLLWFFVLINLRGARTAGWVQILTTVLKLVPLVAVVMIGLWYLLVHPAAYVEHIPRNPQSFSDVTAASTIALYAMLGIECATIPACRVRDPERTIPLATVIGSLVTGIIFFLVSIVPMLLIPQQELAASNAPFADLFSRVMGSHSGELVALFVIISGLGALNGWTLLLGEVTQNVARRGHFPRVLARENSFGAPTSALVVTGLIASAMLLVNYTDSIAAGFAFFSNVVTAANLPMYFICCVALLVLHRRRGLPPAGRSRRVWIIAFLSALYCVWASIGIGLKPLLWTLALCGLGLVVYGSSVWLSRRALRGLPEPAHPGPKVAQR